VAGPGPWQSAAAQPGASAAATLRLAPPPSLPGGGECTSAGASDSDGARRRAAPRMAPRLLAILSGRCQGHAAAGVGGCAGWPAAARAIAAERPVPDRATVTRSLSEDWGPVPAHSPPAGRPAAPLSKGARFIRPRLRRNAPNAGVTVMTPESEQPSPSRPGVRLSPHCPCGKLLSLWMI
jgi:hypothetical protein